MAHEFYDKQEILRLLQDVFFDTVRDVLVEGDQEDVHPASTVSAIGGIRRFIDDVKRRLDANATGEWGATDERDRS